MNVLATLTGEMSDTKVAGVFNNERLAREVARQARAVLGLRPSQVQVVTRRDSHPGRKLEPEGRGIFRTALIAHFKLGVVGMVLGVLVFVSLHTRDVPAVVNSPGMAAMAILLLGGFAGLLAGGLVTLRPDHTPLLAKVDEALGEGRYAVVVHAFDDDQSACAQAFLAGQGGETIRTL